MNCHSLFSTTVLYSLTVLEYLQLPVSTRLFRASIHYTCNSPAYHSLQLSSAIWMTFKFSTGMRASWPPESFHWASLLVILTTPCFVISVFWTLFGLLHISGNIVICLLPYTARSLNHQWISIKYFLSYHSARHTVRTRWKNKRMCPHIN
jgi:hypothetical protein